MNPMSPITRMLFEDSCAPCRPNPSCAARFDCMRTLPVDQVAQAALSVASLLQTTENAASRSAA